MRTDRMAGQGACDSFAAGDSVISLSLSIYVYIYIYTHNNKHDNNKHDSNR